MTRKRLTTHMEQICQTDRFQMDLGKDLYTCAVCGQSFMAAAGYGITDIL